MIALLLVAAAFVSGEAPAQPQDHAEHSAHGAQPAPAPAAPPTPHHHAGMDMAPPADPSCPPEHAAMGHCTPKTAEAGRKAAEPAPVAPSPQAENTPPPGGVEATYADRIWGRDAMAPARNIMRREHGGMAFSQVMLDLAEVQFRAGRDTYRWEGALWYGGDLNRLTVKTEGEGTFSGKADAEVQALYSRAIGPYFNLQAGLRQDITPGPDRTYATLGFEGLAPYWFDVEGAVFLSNKGDVLARLEGYYDQRITQRLILQPRAELNLSAQRIPSRGIGAGLTDAELGLRLRYEIARELAPYVGVSWERQLGETARLAQASGERTGGFSLVAGIRAWF